MEEDTSCSAATCGQTAGGSKGVQGESRVTVHEFSDPWRFDTDRLVRTSHDLPKTNA